MVVAVEGEEEEPAGEEEVGEGEDQGDPPEGTSCHGDEYGCFHVQYRVLLVSWFLLNCESINKKLN